MRPRGGLTALALLLGCSLSTTRPDEDGGDAGGVAAADAGARDAATDSAGAVVADADDTGAPDASIDAAWIEHQGSVLVLSDALDDSIVASAFFGPRALDPDPLDCVVARAGVCAQRHCTGPSPLSEDAGRIDVLGDGMAVASMSDPTHYTTFSFGPLGGGARLTVSAAGATVPPFSVSTTVPEEARTVSVPMVHDRTSDLVVTWAPSAGPLVVSVVALRNPVDVECDVDAASGSVTIAASLLDAFPAGTVLGVSAEVWNRARITAGDYTIDVYAYRSTLASSTLR